MQAACAREARRSPRALFAVARCAIPAIALVAATAVEAVERSWRIAQADVVVVGTLAHSKVLTGPHWVRVTGAIRVDRHLYGPHRSAKILFYEFYEFICDGCERGQGVDVDHVLLQLETEKAYWFLTRRGVQSPGRVFTGAVDVGWAPLDAYDDDEILKVLSHRNRTRATK